VRIATVVKALVGCGQAVPEGVWLEEDSQVIVVAVRPKSRAARRCGICRRRSARFDAGAGRRRWRHLDAAGLKCFLEAEAPRVRCRAHGVVVAAVPWARHDAGHTRDFDAAVAWMATECSQSAVATLMRTAWRTVGAILTRYQAEQHAGIDRLAGLARIGIDEISYRRGHKYMTVIVDHDSRRVVWMADGHGKDVLRRFFDTLGPERAAALSHISADGADWIADVVADRAPNAVRCMDPFHVVAWATDALDTVRRQVWNAERGGRAGRTAGSVSLKKARWALWRNPEDLSEAQQAKLDWIAKAHPRLHRAYLLKEGLRLVFALARSSLSAALEALEGWITWARRCRIPEFVALQRTVLAHRDAIEATVTHGLSNGLIESTNTKTRLIIRRGFGFRSAEAIIALVMLSLSGHRPELPRRQTA
jgi:transposase